ERGAVLVDRGHRIPAVADPRVGRRARVDRPGGDPGEPRPRRRLEAGVEVLLRGPEPDLSPAVGPASGDEARPASEAPSPQGGRPLLAGGAGSGAADRAGRDA